MANIVPGAVWSSVQLKKGLFNAISILLSWCCGNSCKSQFLISSVDLCFVLSGNMETNQRFSEEHYHQNTFLSFISIFFLWALLLWEIHSCILSQWYVTVILATLYLSFCYNQNTSGPSGSNQLLSVCESNQKTWGHNIIIMERIKQC